MRLDLHLYLHEAHDHTGCELLDAIADLKETLMGSVQDVKDAIAAERAEVQAKLAALVLTIEALTAEVAAGKVATTQDLDDIKAAVQDISEPESPPVS